MTTAVRTAAPAVRSWTTPWSAYLAAGWSAVYGALALYWALGGAGFPFGAAGDPGAVLSVLGGVSPETAAPTIAVLCLVGAVVAAAMTRTPGRLAARAGLLGFAWAAATGLALVIPDYRVLMAVAYLPIILVGAPFGWPPGANILDAFPWPVTNQLICIAGGVLWAAAAVAYHRRSRSACGRCGRAHTGAGWAAPAAAARWGRWAVYVAATMPVVYAVTRLAWALGIPLGISEDLLRSLQESGMWMAGAALATMGVGGSILTLGLIQRWGEVFPRWMPGLAGRRVPPAIAIVPASLVSVLVTTAGLMFIRLQLTGTLEEVFAFGSELRWAAIAPELLWPLWGVALGAATLAYYYRRRGRCTHCGRG